MANILDNIIRIFDWHHSNNMLIKQQSQSIINKTPRLIKQILAASYPSQEIRITNNNVYTRTHHK